MKKVKELIKKEEAKRDVTPNSVGLVEQDVLPPEIMRELENKMPEWLKQLQRDGTAVLRWNQEYLILLEEVLRKDFGFSEGDVQKMEGRVKEMLPHLYKMQLEGLTILNHENMRVAMNIVDIYKQQLKEQDTGIVLPGKGRVTRLR
jgi:hypothetical protein